MRHTDASLEQQNCAIEGDDTGMMGAHQDWPQIPLDAEQYQERICQQRTQQEEFELRQRLLVSDPTSEKI